MLRRPSPPNPRKLPAHFRIEDPIRMLVLSGASRAKDLSSVLIYTLKIRNRRKPRPINNLHFSNLCKSRAFSAALDHSVLSSTGWPHRCSSGGRGLSVGSPGAPGAGVAGVSTPQATGARSLPPCFLAPLPPRLREPRAKSRRILIYGDGIKPSRKLLKTKDGACA